MGGVGCAGEHGEVVTEAIGVASINSGLAFLPGVMPGVPPLRAGLGGGHQDLIDWQLRHTIGLAGLIDEPDYLLPYFQVVCQAGAVLVGRNFRGSRYRGVDRQCHASTLPGAAGGGDLRTPLRLGDGDPKGQHLLHCYRVRSAGGNKVVRTAGADDETTAFSNFQSVTFIATYMDGFG